MPPLKRYGSIVTKPGLCKSGYQRAGLWRTKWNYFLLGSSQKTSNTVLLLVLWSITANVPHQSLLHFSFQESCLCRLKIVKSLVTAKAAAAMRLLLVEDKMMKAIVIISVVFSWACKSLLLTGESSRPVLWVLLTVCMFQTCVCWQQLLL